MNIKKRVLAFPLGMLYKKRLAVFFVFGIALFGLSQMTNTKAKDVVDLKGRIILIASKPSNQLIYDNLLFALQEEWTLSDSVLQQPASEATKLLLSTEKKFARVQLHRYEISNERNFSIPDLDLDLDDFSVTSGKGRTPKLVISTEEGVKYYMALPEEPDYTREMFLEAVRRGVFMLNEIEREGSWNKAYLGLDNKYSNELEQRTLLISNDYIEDSVQRADIDSLYPYKKAFVDIKFIDSILEKKDDKYAYLIMTGEAYMNIKYICAAEDSKVFTRAHVTSGRNISHQADGITKYFLRPQDIKDLVKNLGE